MSLFARFFPKPNLDVESIIFNFLSVRLFSRKSEFRVRVIVVWYRKFLSARIPIMNHRVEAGAVWIANTDLRCGQGLRTCPRRPKRGTYIEPNSHAIANPAASATN